MLVKHEQLRLQRVGMGADPLVPHQASGSSTAPPCLGGGHCVASDPLRDEKDEGEGEWGERGGWEIYQGRGVGWSVRAGHSGSILSLLSVILWMFGVYNYMCVPMAPARAGAGQLVEGGKGTGAYVGQRKVAHARVRGSARVVARHLVRVGHTVGGQAAGVLHFGPAAAPHKKAAWSALARWRLEAIKGSRRASRHFRAPQTASGGPQEPRRAADGPDWQKGQSQAFLRVDGVDPGDVEFLEAADIGEHVPATRAKHASAACRKAVPHHGPRHCIEPDLGGSCCRQILYDSTDKDPCSLPVLGPCSVFCLFLLVPWYFCGYGRNLRIGCVSTSVSIRLSSAV